MCVLSSSLHDTGLERKPIVVHMCECVQTFCSHTNTMLYICMCVCLSVVMFSFEQIVTILYKSCLILLFFFVLPLLLLLMLCTEGNTILPETRRENWWTDRYEVQVGLHFDTYFFEFKDPYIYCRISNWQNETRQNTTNIFKILFLVDCVSLQVHDFIQRISCAWEEGREISQIISFVTTHTHTLTVDNVSRFLLHDEVVLVVWWCGLSFTTQQWCMLWIDIVAYEWL